MDPAVPLPASIIRLAEQMQRLSEVAEGLTYRLLELEERLSGMESTMARGGDQELAASHAAAIEQTDLRLMDTEDRLDRLEALLQHAAHPPVGADGRGALALVQDPHREAETEHLPDDSQFIEEGEQPFMDDLIA